MPPVIALLSHSRTEVGVGGLSATTTVVSIIYGPNRTFRRVKGGVMDSYAGITYVKREDVWSCRKHLPLLVPD